MNGRDEDYYWENKCIQHHEPPDYDECDFCKHTFAWHELEEWGPSGIRLICPSCELEKRQED